MQAGQHRGRGDRPSGRPTDVDDKLLAEAAEIFGTTTKVATVNAALEDAIKRRKRESFADWLKSGGLPDLTGPVQGEKDPYRAA